MRERHAAWHSGNIQPAPPIPDGRAGTGLRRSASVSPKPLVSTGLSQSSLREERRTQLPQRASRTQDAQQGPFEACRGQGFGQLDLRYVFLESRSRSGSQGFFLLRSASTNGFGGMPHSKVKPSAWQSPPASPQSPPRQSPAPAHRAPCARLRSRGCNPHRRETAGRCTSPR